MRGRRGFTLVEMLVVIAVILVMMALMGVFVQSLVEKARYADTQGLIQSLQKACEAYHTDNGVYPANDRGGSPSLHYHLGRPREHVVFEGDEKIVRRGKPYLRFLHRWLRTPSDPDVRPSAVLDAWGNELGYAYPGTYTRGGGDIWSAGANGVAEMDPADPAFDDVNTWVVDN